MAVELNLQDIVEVRLEYVGPSLTIAYNILHYRLANATPVGSGTPPFEGVPMEQVGGVIAETVMGHVVEEWQATAANTVVMSGASCQHVWPIPKSRRYNYIPPEQAAGTIASDPMPLQDSACLVKRSAFGQRWGIGRLFHVGLPENGQSGGRLNPALVSAINDFGESLEEAISVATPDYTYTLVPVLPAYDAMGIPRKLQILEVTLTNDIIKTQRRRRPGKGI